MLPIVRWTLFVLIASAAMAVAAPSQAVVGGSVAAPGRWPFMAALAAPYGTDAASGLTCGGTVIAPRRVLTAAHCVLGEAPTDLVVVVGRDRLSQSGGRVVAIRGIAVFPGYVDDAQPLDAAVVELAADAGVAPVRLAGPGDAGAWTPGTPAWTAGWGQLNGKPSPGGDTYYADRLRELQLPLVGDDACETAFGGGDGHGLIYRPRWNVCAGGADGRAGTCFGDSGGPLAVPTDAGWLQVGITQTGDACASAGYYDIFTRADRVAAFARRAGLRLQPWPLASPRVSGRLRAGALVSCSRGRWANRPTAYEVAWYEVQPQPKPVDRGVRHRVSRADQEHGLVCAVTAANAGGYDQAYSSPRG